MNQHEQAEYARWKMDCICCDAARQFNKAWLRDRSVDIEPRYAVAFALLEGERWH